MPGTVHKNALYETFKLDPEKVDKVLDQVKAIVHEGNIRRIVLRDAKGGVLIEAPLTVGVVGAALVPVWTAIGAIVALVSDCAITLEKRE